MLLVAGLVAISLSWLTPITAHAAELSCTGIVGAQSYEQIEVPPNATCTLNGTRVDGTIKVGVNATLQANGVIVGGNIQAEGATTVFVGTGSTVGGSIQIKQGGRATVNGVQVTGDIQLESNAGALSVTANRVGGNIQIVQNRGGAAITDNRIDGNLQCKENSPAPTGGRNVAASFEDQCAGFAGQPAAPTPTATPVNTPIAPAPTASPTAPAPGGGDGTCRGSIGAQRYENLDVPDGASCTLNGTRVDGNIKVGTNATLHALNVTVGGNIQADGALDVTVNNNSMVGGSIQIKQGGSATVDGVRVTGDIQLESNAGALSVTDNRVGGNVQIVQNQGAVTINDNRIDGNIQCKENSPAPTGGRNQAASFEDQCANFAGAPILPTPPTPGAESINCQGTIGAQQYANLVVPAGASCTLIGTHITGDVTVGAGSTLQASALKVDGHLQAQGAAVVTVNHNSTVGGNLALVEGGSATVDRVQVTGDLRLTSNKRALSATRNRVGGNFQAVGNAAGMVVSSNVIVGTLQCQNNQLPPLGGANQAAGLEEQCASLNLRLFLPVVVGQ
jgi:hypothetical protein